MPRKSISATMASVSVKALIVTEIKLVQMVLTKHTASALSISSSVRSQESASLSDNFAMELRTAKMITMNKIVVS